MSLAMAILNFTLISQAILYWQELAELQHAGQFLTGEDFRQVKNLAMGFACCSDRNVSLAAFCFSV